MPLIRPFRACSACLLLLLPALAGALTPPADHAAQAWHDARQMVLVITPDWNANQGTLQRFERRGDGWHDLGPAQPITIGRAGAAWGVGLNPVPDDNNPHKREGDGRSPAGVFTIGQAFGYAEHADTALDYRQMQADSYCDDVSGSRYYNRIVDEHVVGAEAVKGASEHMRLDLANDGDQRYRIGFVIEHNQAQKPMHGSCIFAHLWKRPGASTSGCTAMASATMHALTGWLRPEQHPVFVLLPQPAYARLAHDWQLPSTGPAE